MSRIISLSWSCDFPSRDTSRLVNCHDRPNDAAVLIERIESAVRTLRLYDPAPPDADGWHAVRSPGGYECWHFDAEDDSGQLRLVAGLCEGYVFHPGYLRRYYQYLADPTRHVPPLPEEYPCTWFAVFEGGRVLAEFLTQRGRRNSRPAQQGLTCGWGRTN